MNEEILINFSPMETRVALIENGILQELHVERNHQRGIVGNIYLGKITRVLPGMQAAFVDIGLERKAFIHVDDLHTNKATRTKQSIATLLRAGQSLPVQVVKDPIGTKGARLTTQISISSRYLVYLPGTNQVAISQRIEDEAEKQRLKQIVEDYIHTDDGSIQAGFILRTAAEDVLPEELHADIDFLHQLWRQLQEKTKTTTAPATIREELPLSLRTLRDLAHLRTKRILIDSRITFHQAKTFVTQWVPDVVSVLEYYSSEQPIFELYNIEHEIQKALNRKVLLKSGGYLIIDPTEAMTTIDINTGGYIGHRNLEETLFKTNLEAAMAIGRQLRLRNLGGIIILDFIDMVSAEHQRQVIRTLEQALEKDRAKIKLTGLSELGLVEMTRKRTRQSLQQMLCESCCSCNGTGIVRTPTTICGAIFRSILRIARVYHADTYRVLASQSVIDQLLDEEAQRLAELEKLINKTIYLQVEPMYFCEQFDVVTR